MKRSVRGILINDGKILLMNITRTDCDGGYYTFVGGSVEEGEEPETAIVREMKEEANFDVEVIKNIYTETYDNGVENVYFLCRLIGENNHV